jgi:NIMA (never in mitosis gene a)-related kinase 2
MKREKPTATVPSSKDTSGLQFEKYEWLEEIGKGSFGAVSKVRRRADGKVLVWKELNYAKMSEKEKKMLVSEVNILRELNHQNIVRYYDRVIDRDHSKIFIVMEYCEGGDISTLIKSSRKESKHIPEEMIWHIVSQVLLALQTCHSRPEGKILHRDLKPGNIFLDADHNVKLGDFGLSRVMGDESVFAYTHVGTPYYMSPEQINEQKYNEKSDIWSLGCIIYEIAALRAPFEATTHY